MPTVLLIRHAQASYGTADYDALSEQGERQIDTLRRSLDRRRVEPSCVVTGDLGRQRGTAHPLLESGAATVTVDPRWDEYDDDDVLTHHSTTAARVERRDGDDRPALTSREYQVLLDAALQHWIDAGPDSPCAETWPQFLARITAALEHVAAGLASGQTGLVISSSGVIAGLASALLGAPERAFVALNRVSVNTAVTKIIAGSRGMTLVSYNEHAHLEEAGGRLITYR